MDKGPIISAFIGGAFFAIPYLALDLSIAASLGIGVVAFGAGNLLLSNNKEKSIVINNGSNNLYDTLNEAKKVNAEIYSMMNKVENKELIQNIREIHDSATKIIDTISKNPGKLNQAETFFSYYLPVTLKILKKYDEIENQRLSSNEGREFMKSSEKMISKINVSFKSQLSNLYQSDMVDVDAEIKVLDNMLKTEGFGDVKDFNIK